METEVQPNPYKDYENSLNDIISHLILSFIPAEKALSIFGQGEVWNPNLKEVVELAEIEPDTMIRIIRRGSVRLLSEEKVCIYHNLENARVYQGSEFKCIEIDDEVSGDNDGR